MRCRLVEVMVNDSPPRGHRLYRQKWIIAKGAHDEQTLVIAIIREHFVAWLEEVNCDGYLELHHATDHGQIEVPDDLIADAWLMVGYKRIIDKIREKHHIDVYEIFNRAVLSGWTGKDS